LFLRLVEAKLGPTGINRFESTHEFDILAFYSIFRPMEVPGPFAGAMKAGGFGSDNLVRKAEAGEESV
jgi:hypothetical protein